MSSALYHINPDRLTPWNTIPDLPVNEGLYRTLDIFEQLGKSKAALARLHGRSAVIPNQGLLINTISLQEAKASSEIENIFTTDDELYKAFSTNEIEVTGSQKEVLHYREALWEGHRDLNENKAFSIDYFTRIFREVKQTDEGVRPEFINTTIKMGGTGPNAGNVIYTPPKGRDLLTSKLENLADFLNDDERYNMDHLIKMAIGHYQFEAIHPFRDGNGRTGRIINIHYLTAKGLLDYPILYLSRYILEHKNDYYSALMGVSQRGSWQEWLLFIMRAVESTANLTYHKINDIVSTRESIVDYLKKEAKEIRQSELLVNHLFTQPFTKVKHLTDSGLYAENTARDYLNKLASLGVVQKKSISGHHYYLNTELYRILSE